MLIKSQAGDYIFNVPMDMLSHIHILNTGNSVMAKTYSIYLNVYTNLERTSDCLGYYNSEEEAIYVLDQLFFAMECNSEKFEIPAVKAVSSEGSKELLDSPKVDDLVLRYTKYPSFLKRFSNAELSSIPFNRDLSKELILLICSKLTLEQMVGFISDGHMYKAKIESIIKERWEYWINTIVQKPVKILGNKKIGFPSHYISFYSGNSRSLQLTQSFSDYEDGEGNCDVLPVFYIYKWGKHNDKLLDTLNNNNNN